MKNMIFETLKTEGPMGAGKLAELIGEDCEAVKLVLADMTDAGLLVKNGAHRWQVAAVKTERRDVSKTDQNTIRKTVADVLADMEFRLSNTPVTIKNASDKIDALRKLAEMSEQPLQNMLYEIAGDIEAAAK